MTQTLKNVGTPAIYTVRTEVPSGISLKVEPNTLKFQKINEEKTFKVPLEAKRDGEGGEYVFGRLIWSDGEHYVRSSIVVNATTMLLIELYVTSSVRTINKSMFTMWKHS